MDKTELQQVLSGLDPLDAPDAELEQYRTPPRIAADVLHRMDLAGDCDGDVVDLGCGNGVFTIGAALQGADAVGIDVDAAAVATARRNVEAVHPAIQRSGGTASVRESDVRDIAMTADAVVMNPPFGLQVRDMNRVFLDAAFDIAPVAYAILHQSRENTAATRQFLERFADDHGFESDVLTAYDLPIPRRFAFHEDEKKHIKVDLYRFRQV